MHAMLGLIGAVGLAGIMWPVEESPLLRSDDLGRLILWGGAALGLVAGLVEGLLLRLSRHEVGQGLGMVVVSLAATPVFYALVFAYAPWGPDLGPVPVGNLVTALLSWLVFLLCTTAGALLAAPRDSARCRSQRSNR